MCKKILAWLFAAGVLLLSVAMALGFFWPAKAGANEVLAKEPALTNKDGSFNDDVLADVASWLSDHFFGRQELISVHNLLTSRLFGTSSSDDVIYGSDGWLYYSPTLPGYTGTEPMTQRQLFAAANNLKLMREYCRSQGRDFAFMLAPNKNSLYPENMPDYGVTAQISDAQRLHEALEEAGVAYIDLFAAFGAREETLYFAHDSHWNSYGAALGADCINEAFGVKSDYFGGDFSGTREHLGDLHEMLYPAFKDSERDLVYGGELDFIYTSKATKPDSITLLTRGGGEKSLLCYRDSFGNLLYPYLADSYGDARFSRSTAYDLTQPGECVLIELVERNIAYLYTNLPVMPATQRVLEMPQPSGTVAVEIKEARSPEGTWLVRGSVADSIDEDSPVYIVCDAGTYEAFCLDGGFGAYVPAGNVQAVAWYENGVLRSYSVQ